MNHVPHKPSAHQADTPFSPPRREPFKGLSLLLALTISLGSLYLFAYWLQERQSLDKTASSLAEPPTVLRSHPIKSERDAQQAKAGSGIPRLPATGLQRCDVGGKTTYTDQGCPSDAHVQVMEYPREALSSLDGSGRSITLYLCKGVGTFWSREHCQHRGTVVQRLYTVPAHLSLEQQVNFARQRQNDLSAPSDSAPVIATATASNDKAQQCGALNQYIAQLDAYARQPLFPAEQDRVRQDRQAARDQQFRLSC